MVEAGDGGSGRHVEVTSNHHWAIEGGDSIEAVEEETKIRAFTRGVDVGRNDNEGMGAIGDADCQCRIIGSRADQGCGVVAVNGDEKTIAALVGKRAREDFIVGESDGGISREASFLEEEHGRDDFIAEQDDLELLIDKGVDVHSNEGEIGSDGGDGGGARGGWARSSQVDTFGPGKMRTDVATVVTDKVAKGATYSDRV